MKIKQAFKNFNNNIFPDSYYLKGSDHFLQEFFIQKVCDLKFKNKNFDKILLIPDDLIGKNIIDEFSTNDLFGNKKLFILKNFQKLKSKEQTFILNYCKNPIDNQLLFIINDDWMKKTTYLNKLEQLIGFIDVQTPYGTDMKKWINYLFKLKGKKVDNRVVETLLDMVGDSLSNVNNEIEKICLFIKDKKIVDYKEIKHFSGWINNRKKWQLLLSIAEKDFDKSIFLCKILLSKGTSIISLVYSTTTLLQELLYAKMNMGTFSNYRGYIGLPLSIKKRISFFKESYSILEIEKGLLELGKIDRKQKTETSIDEADFIQFIGEFVGT